MEKNCKNNRQKKFHQTKFQNKKFRKNFVKLFLAIVVPQPIWGMPAKIWGV
jgi:hypothetical protein